MPVYTTGLSGFSLGLGDKPAAKRSEQSQAAGAEQSQAVPGRAPHTLSHGMSAISELSFPGPASSAPDVSILQPQSASQPGSAHSSFAATVAPPAAAAAPLAPLQEAIILPAPLQAANVSAVQRAKPAFVSAVSAQPTATLRGGSAVRGGAAGAANKGSGGQGGSNSFFAERGAGVSGSVGSGPSKLGQPAAIAGPVKSSWDDLLMSHPVPVLFTGARSAEKKRKRVQGLLM